MTKKRDYSQRTAHPLSTEPMTALTWPYKREGFNYKDLPGHLGCYLVCDGGWFVDMRPLPDGYELLGTDAHKRGYYIIPIINQYGQRELNIPRDRTILQLFGEPTETQKALNLGLFCKHRDNDPTNGSIQNLYWDEPIRRKKEVVDDLLRRRQMGFKRKEISEDLDLPLQTVDQVLYQPSIVPGHESHWSPTQLQLIEAYRSQQRLSQDSFLPLADLTDEQILGLKPKQQP